MISDLVWSACKKLNCLTYLNGMWLPFLVVSSLNLCFCLHSKQEGGILIAWRDGTFSVIQHLVHRYSVSVLLCGSTGSPWWLTGVYGPQHDEDKISFLADLREVRSSCPGPFVLAGDFNMIYCSEDKNNDNVNRAMMGRFRRFVNELDLKEIPLWGRRYTWSNERESPTLVKLDRVLCTNDGNTSIQTICCKVLLLRCLITAHCFWVFAMGLWAREDFTLKVFGHASQDFLKRFSGRGMNRCSLRAFGTY